MPTPSSIRLSRLFLYPVKSLRGVEVTSAEIDELGLVGDRRFLVIDQSDRFLTQRVLPRMALIAATIEGPNLQLAAAGTDPIQVPLQADPKQVTLRSVTIWKSEGLQAEDCGNDSARWLTSVLGTPCRLVRIGPAFHRPVVKPTARPGDVAAFTDAYPFMAISRASLDDLNARLASRGEPPVVMERFRPSFVLEGCEPYAEDTWAHFHVGEIALRAGGPCARCVVTTIDPGTAERGKEPLSLLATYRRDANDSTRINFGQNLLHETKRGVLRVGDAVTSIVPR